MMRRSIAFLSALLVAGCGQPTPSANGGNDQVAASAPSSEIGKGVDRSHKGTEAPAAAFKDPSGEETTIGDFEGKPVLVNLWASWCAPCVKELPTLGRLAASQSRVAVISVSQDVAPQASIQAFLTKHGVGDFAAYRDPTMALSGALGVQIMPTSVLYDAKGLEVWRYVGDLDWASADAARLLAEAGPSSETK